MKTMIRKMSRMEMSLRYHLAAKAALDASASQNLPIRVSLPAVRLSFCMNVASMDVSGYQASCVYA